MNEPCRLSACPAVSLLRHQARHATALSIPALMEKDPERSRAFCVQAAGLELDYSRHLVDRETLANLIALAGQANLEQRTAALFAGEIVNPTENRPALHTLLRARDASGLDDLFDEVLNVRARMRDLADRCGAGQQRGFRGEPITDVVNIGIGGSDLGPRLVSSALKPLQGPVRVHYVANVDPADLEDTLQPLNPATTLFIICSKSFRTEETLSNSLLARGWLQNAGAGPDDLARHFFAVTTNLQAAAEFGMPAPNCLPMWDWVGGRYSVWSAVGLSCAIALGWRNFERLLAGAEAMDAHFRRSPAAQNMPVIMSLLELWYCEFLGAGNHVVLPYHQHLARLPDYLQQLTMESNGKQVDALGQPLEGHSAPVLWGAAGTMGQHSFHQLLHQGTRLCPVDFVLPLASHLENREPHQRLVANCLAQARALMVGRSAEEALDSLTARGCDAAQAAKLAPHLVMPGNRPSSIISMQRLTPETLGALLALYEHRTFCSAQLWGINPFDQWGVELGKEIGSAIFGRLNDEHETQMLDAATERLIARWHQARH